MRNFFHVARNTFRECLREPIFFVLLISSITLIGLFPSMTLFVFRQQVKLVIDSSMATTLVFGLVTAVLCASHTIAREMENGTVLLLLSKPVPRWSFILSKLLGVLSALTVFVFICNLASLISLRVAKDQFQLDFFTMIIYFSLIGVGISWGAFRNYHAQKSFSETTTIALMVLLFLLILFLPMINVEGRPPEPIGQVIPALLLLFFAVWGMGAITVMLSAKFDMVTNLLISAILFFAGLVSDYFLGNAAGTPSLKALLYALIPNWQFFWLADALTNKQPIPLAYVGWAGVYIIFYITLCSVIAVTLFSDKEIAEKVR